MNKFQMWVLEKIVLGFSKKIFKEGEMETKKWYQSKGIWTGVVTVVMAVYDVLVPLVPIYFGITLPIIPEWVFVLLGAFGIYSRKTASTKIG